MTSRNYLLLTPGPLTTSRTVKEAMLFDSCTWMMITISAWYRPFDSSWCSWLPRPTVIPQCCCRVAAATRSKRCSAASSANRAKC
ncbi:2-aminoethylphosphonate:pyruvate aminotransferase [Klebsiella pneumoniae ISC21]|nr:2-aminoethylphosphonate:pyruvate aminotransferase [Klebsiella pneumoniae ISC21]